MRSIEEDFSNGEKKKKKKLQEKDEGEIGECRFPLLLGKYIIHFFNRKFTFTCNFFC